MDDLALVRRMAEQVRDATADYATGHEDYADIIKHRPGDVTRRIDLAAEEALDQAVFREGLKARIVSEEIGERIVPAGTVPELTLLCDPVDGSNNFISGISYYCTTLALSRKPDGATFADIDAAAVSSPHMGTFYAAKGKGAFLNGRPIKAGRTGYKPIYSIYVYGSGTIPGGLITLQEKDCIVRTMGSIALDICMVARGSFDAVIDTRNKVSGYDVMAAGRILREAGGNFLLLHGQNIEDMPLDATGLSIIGAAEEVIRDKILRDIEL
ncbi:inositol monophosphatase family protein [Methanocella sp. MCL-LM]|uniref:inositol monophosphatase family protein n=1 Tax=Methanocella sp. MCL-LM TaxID=3412035 RepID=UPI003C762CC9